MRSDVISRGASYSKWIAGAWWAVGIFSGGCSDPASWPCQESSAWKQGLPCRELQALTWAEGAALVLTLATALYHSDWVISILPLCIPWGINLQASPIGLFWEWRGYKNIWSKQNSTNKLNNDPRSQQATAVEQWHVWRTHCPPFLPQNSTVSGRKSGNASFSPSISSLQLCGEHTSAGPMPRKKIILIQLEWAVCFGHYSL